MNLTKDGRQVVISDVVEYTDHYGFKIPALITTAWGECQYDADDSLKKLVSAPAVNLVYVSRDKNETDSCGRQTSRDTSVVHFMNQSAHGNYWNFYKEGIEVKYRHVEGSEKSH